jgi:diguanylate cyclase (GGDEF)-like protein
MSATWSTPAGPGAATGRPADRPLPADQSLDPGPQVQLSAHNHVLDLIVQNASLPIILQVITAMIERQVPGSRASILLLDEEGLRLRVAAGPSLPADYNTAIDDTPIGPAVGTCGVAAHAKRITITRDIAEDAAWDQWRSVAEAAGLAACWSTPFFGLRNRVLGTFAVYFDAPRSPVQAELDLLQDAGFLTAVAVQQDAVRRQLHTTSRTHPLTGLPNRVVLNEELRAVEATAAETGRRFAVIHLAVEGIAPINESLGATIGDELLRTVAARLTTLVNGIGLAAHLWGCDFVLLVGSLADDHEAQRLAERVRRVLTEPFDIEGMTLLVGVTLGLAIYGGEVLDGHRPADEPLRGASVALERAVTRGEAIGVYERDTDPAADAYLIAPELQRGIAAEELDLAYQPVVALADGRIDHYEALLRWTTARGTVPPDAFVPVAERTGLVGDLGRYALERALAELGRQREAGRDIGMSVNLSVRQLSDDGLPALIGELVGRYSLPPERVTMEVTEGVLLTSSARGWETLSHIRDLGVRIALDDFGTGFSQIGYLRRFPFDEIKIDRTFVQDMGEHVTSRAIIVGTIGFAKSAGLTTVAEGIETRDQADQLLELGCDLGQGFLYGEGRAVASPG